MGGVALAKGVSAVDTVDATNIIGNVPLANGGTEVSLVNPHANDILFFNNGTGHVDWLSIGSGLAISGTTMTATGSAGSVTSVAASGNQGVTITGSPITSSGTIGIGLGNISPLSVTTNTITGRGSFTVDQAGFSSTTGYASELSGDLPGRNGGGVPWSILSGLYLSHIFDTQDATTQASELEISPVFACNGNTIVTGYGINIDAGTASLTAGGSITTGINLRVAAPGFGSTKYSASFEGAVKVGSSGQLNITSAGIISTGTWQGTSISTTYTDAKITSITGTTNQVIASSSTGAVTLSLPQSIATSSVPQFARLGLGTSTNDNFVVTGTNSVSRQLINLACTNTYSGNLLSVGLLQQSTLQPSSSAITTTMVHNWLYPNTVLSTGAFTVSYGLLIDSGSTTLGSASITTGYSLFAANPSAGTTRWAAWFDGNVNFNANILVGTTTQSNSTLMTLSSTIQNSARITFSGQEFFQPSNTFTEGVSFLLGVNRANNKQVWIGDSNRLAQSNTNPLIRLAVTLNPIIDGLNTDGSTRDLYVQTNGSNLIIGQGTLTTTSTTGFVYIPTCVGIPTGIPATITGYVPIVWDSAHNGLYVYNGGWLLA